MTRVLRRMAASPAARDLREARLASPVWLALLVAVAVTVAVLSRGQLLTPEGWSPIPLEMTR